MKPAKIDDNASCEAASVLTQSTAFALNASLESLLRFMQTSNVGGSSVTLHTADAVNAHRPAGPSDVMTLTAAPSRAIALR